MKSNSEATIGHNGAPPEDVFGLHIDDLFSTLSDSLSGGDVVNDAQEAAIDALLDEFRKASKDADGARAAEKKPFDEAAKAVQAKWKPIIEKADRGVTACKAALTPYRVAKQRAAEEAARKAREEAEARERAAIEALRQSEDLEAKFDAERELEASKKLAAVANKIDRAPTGLRTVWRAEITDRKAALLHYLNRSPERFEALIQQMADEDARGTRAPVPGIVFHEEKKAA
jgi:hypothetical protein